MNKTVRFTELEMNNSTRILYLLWLLLCSGKLSCLSHAAISRLSSCCVCFFPLYLLWFLFIFWGFAQYFQRTRSINCLYFLLNLIRTKTKQFQNPTTNAWALNVSKGNSSVLIYSVLSGCVSYVLCVS